MEKEKKENSLETNFKDLNLHKEEQLNQNEKILNSIEKYFSLIILEFKEHLQKYNSMFTEISQSTKEHFDIFNNIINDYANEIEQNQICLYELISKMNIINDELPRVEELYYKIKEMRIGLEKVYKEYSKQMEKK